MARGRVLTIRPRIALGPFVVQYARRSVFSVTVLDWVGSGHAYSLRVIVTTDALNPFAGLFTENPTVFCK
jgi:hypothetical protein